MTNLDGPILRTDDRVYHLTKAIARIETHLGTNPKAPGTSRERSAHDAVGGVDAGLRAALVELADRWGRRAPIDPETELRAVLSACVSPGQKSQPQLGPLGDRGTQ